MIFNKIKQLCWLFSVHFFISSFTFGGGYVVIPMIRKFFVQEKKLFDEEELLDMAAIAQSTPGAIAVNLSALSGYRVAGIPGILISSIASVLPALILLSLISKCYAAFAANSIVAAVLKGMQAGVAALIVDLAIDMTHRIVVQRSLFFTLMVPFSFIACSFFHVNVALILIICCILCILRVFYQNKMREKT